MGIRFKYAVCIDAAHWQVRETYKEWLATNIGPRGIDWSFMWDSSGLYTVKFTKEPDLLAFKLRFQCVEVNTAN